MGANDIPIPALILVGPWGDGPSALAFLLPAAPAIWSVGRCHVARKDLALDGAQSEPQRRIARALRFPKTSRAPRLGAAMLSISPTRSVQEREGGVRDIKFRPNLLDPHGEPYLASSAHKVGDTAPTVAGENSCRSRKGRSIRSYRHRSESTCPAKIARYLEAWGYGGVWISNPYASAVSVIQLCRGAQTSSRRSICRRPRYGQFRVRREIKARRPEFPKSPYLGRPFELRPPADLLVIECRCA